MVNFVAAIRGITVQEWVYHRTEDYVDTDAHLIFEVRVWRSLTHAGNYCCYDNFTVFLYNFLYQSKL